MSSWIFRAYADALDVATFQVLPPARPATRLRPSRPEPPETRPRPRPPAPPDGRAAAPLPRAA